MLSNLTGFSLSFVILALEGEWLQADAETCELPLKPNAS